MEYYKNLSLENIIYVNDQGNVCEEKWKDIKWYEGLYMASDLGRVMSIRKEERRIMKPYMIKNNYLSISFSVKGRLKLYSVHQLVAMAFLNHTPCGYNIIVDHIVENNRLDNRLCNLQLTTPRLNTVKSIVGALSEYTGVSWDKTVSKWRSAIHQDGKSVYLGCYASEKGAYLAYCNALEKINNGEKIPQYINPSKTSKYKGVNWDKSRGKWLVRFKSKNIGRFDNELDAHTAYQKKLEEIKKPYQ